MKPLTQYEMKELVDAMTAGASGAPVGSLWSASEQPDLIFMVLVHANLPTSNGPMASLVMQAIPSGECWIQPTEQFLDGQWENVGFVWDRDSAD